MKKRTSQQPKPSAGTDSRAASLFQHRARIESLRKQKQQIKPVGAKGLKPSKKRRVSAPPVPDRPSSADRAANLAKIHERTVRNRRRSTPVSVFPRDEFQKEEEKEDEEPAPTRKSRKSRSRSRSRPRSGHKSIKAAPTPAAVPSTKNSLKTGPNDNDLIARVKQLVRAKRDADALMEEHQADKDMSDTCRKAFLMYEKQEGELSWVRSEMRRQGLETYSAKYADEMIWDDIFDLDTRKALARDCMEEQPSPLSEIFAALPAPPARQTKKPKKQKKPLTCQEYISLLGSDYSPELLADYEGGATRAGLRRRVGHPQAWYRLFNFTCSHLQSYYPQCPSEVEGTERGRSLVSCTKRELTKRYRQLMIKYHPDKHADSGSWAVFSNYAIDERFVQKCVTAMASLVGVAKNLFDDRQLKCK